MNLVPWRRSGLTEPFQQFQREMDQLMQRFFGETGDHVAGERGAGAAAL